MHLIEKTGNNMTKGINDPAGQDIINSRFNLTEKQAETISFFLNLVVVGFACFGAAASAWLAIPSLLKLIPYEISPLISGTGYLLSVVSGITYAKAQFWDRSYKKIRQWLLGHESENQEEEEKYKKEIKNYENSIKDYLENINDIHKNNNEQNKEARETSIELIKELYKLENKVKDEDLPEFSDILHSLSGRTGLTDEQLNSFFPNDLIKSRADKFYDFMDRITDLSLTVAKCINWFLALNIIFAGSAIAIILTTLGSKNAIFSISSDIFGASTLTGTIIWAPAIFISVFTQVCKLILNGDRQLAELDWLGFTKVDLAHDLKYLQEKSKLLHRCSLDLKHIKSEIESAKKLDHANEKINILARTVEELSPKNIQRSDSSTQTEDFAATPLPKNSSWYSSFNIFRSSSRNLFDLSNQNPHPTPVSTPATVKAKDGSRDFPSTAPVDVENGVSEIKNSDDLEEREFAARLLRQAKF